RSSPRRGLPEKSGHGFPVAQKSVFESGSNVPESQVPPPPHSCRPIQVSEPGSPFAGTVYVRQISLPSFGDKAAMNPRIPLSPPALPTRILSFTARGAEVDIVPLLASAKLRLKSTAPVWRSSETR